MPYRRRRRRTSSTPPPSAPMRSTRRRKTARLREACVAYSNSQDALDGGALNWRKGTSFRLPHRRRHEVEAGRSRRAAAYADRIHIVRLNETRGGQSAGHGQSGARAAHIDEDQQLADDATVRQKLNELRARILKGEDFAGLAHTSRRIRAQLLDGGDLGWAGPAVSVPEFERSWGNQGKRDQRALPRLNTAGTSCRSWANASSTTRTSEAQHAAEEIRASKADEETELWMRRLRDEAYVELRV